ncbi:hypothetical protein, partial [Klebsiella aerogenes]|uniref:hypothetical protein n=1 Tax=Klebsiella aerogenes TaxID=548 RepID=UPI001952D343
SSTSSIALAMGSGHGQVMFLIYKSKVKTAHAKLFTDCICSTLTDWFVKRLAYTRSVAASLE